MVSVTFVTKKVNASTMANFTKKQKQVLVAATAVLLVVGTGLLVAGLAGAFSTETAPVPKVVSVRISTGGRTFEYDNKMGVPADFQPITGANASSRYVVVLELNVAARSVRIKNSGFSIAEGSPKVLEKGKKWEYVITPSQGSSTMGDRPDYLFFPFEVDGTSLSLTGRTDFSAANYKWYQPLGTAEQFKVGHNLVQSQGNWLWQIDLPENYRPNELDYDKMSLFIQDLKDPQEKFQVVQKEDSIDAAVCYSRPDLLPLASSFQLDAQNQH